MSGACKACGETDDRLVSGGFCVDRIACHWRAALTRALTAQAWGVAVVRMEFFRVNWPDFEGKPDAHFADRMYPAPADLAREILGDG